MKKLMMWIVAMCISLQPFAATAAAPSCIADAEGVRHLYPEAWPSWTRHMEGHKNEKCWFPGSKGDKKWKHQDRTPDVAFEHLKISKHKAKKQTVTAAHTEAPVSTAPSKEIYEAEMAASMERYAAKLRQLYEADRILRDKLIQRGMMLR